MSAAPDQTLATLSSWIEALLRNATDLLSEADVLFDSGKYPRAVALAHFAMEEMGKIVSLESQMVEFALGNQPDWNAAEKAWSSHDTKFELFHVIDVISQARTASAVADDLELLQELELRLAGRPLREMALYVDVDAGKARVPSDNFTEDLAKLYLGTAFHAGKVLTESLLTLGERLQQIADHVADPDRRRRFEQTREDFMRRFAKTRVVARRKLLEELQSQAPSDT